MTSEHIASSANTNPSLIRRLVSQLARAGLIRCQMGAGGGALLAKPAARITLRAAYRAVSDGELFGLHRGEPNAGCAVGNNIQALLTERFDQATRALEEELARTTIADLLQDVDERTKKGGRRRRMAG